jgi:hypothetical protein
MANTILTSTIITKEALRVLHNSIKFAAAVTRSYDDSFANSGASPSGKIGPSLRIRKPNRYTVSTGPALAVQDTVEDYATLTVSTQKHVDMRFSTADLSLSIDEFSDRYVRPAMLLLASTIDYDGLQLAANIYNLVGVAGTDPGGASSGDAKAPDVFLNASATLSNYACPESERTAVLSPFAQASSVAGLSGLFNPQSAIGRQYENGTIGQALGMDFKMDQSVARFTTGSRVIGSGTTYTSVSADGTQITCATTTGWTFAAGDVFYFSSGTPVNTVNWETKKDTGTTQKFVVTAAATGASSAVTLTISPSIITSGATQTVTNVPDGSAVLTFIGVASTSYPHNLVFHKDAFALATADLILPRGVDMAERQVHDGISLRLVRQYDINNDNLVARIDVLYGWLTQYAQLACRVIGK